jgi:23S rRNA (cytidine1920-2'-O)/16S rRNA (cytidine1409-2'-O)-methyltransferase
MARAMARTRLDAALVERGLFPTRARAQAAVLAGRVRVDGRAAEKPGTAVVPDSEIDVEATQDYVSRGGQKLANALDALGIDVTGARVLDLGASTGGFTDCLLQRGAKHSVALDVGYGQLDWRLRNDPRVTVLERTNARVLTRDMLPYAPDFVTCDLAFISVATVWPAVAACLDPAYRALILVKPQFEAGRESVGKGGVVRDPAARIDAVRRVAHAVTQAGGRPAGVVESGLPGPAGNHEIFLFVAGPERPHPNLDLETAIDHAVKGHQ